MNNNMPQNDPGPSPYVNQYNGSQSHRNKSNTYNPPNQNFQRSQ